VSRQHARPFYFIFAKDYSIVACHEELRHSGQRSSRQKDPQDTAYVRDARRHTQSVLADWQITRVRTAV